MSSTLLMLHKVVRVANTAVYTIEMASPWYEIDFKGSRFYDSFICGK